MSTLTTQLHPHEKVLFQTRKSAGFYAAGVIFLLIILAVFLYLSIGITVSYPAAMREAEQYNDPTYSALIFGMYRILGPFSIVLLIWLIVFTLVNLIRAEVMLTNQRLLGRLYSKSWLFFHRIDIPLQEMRSIAHLPGRLEVETTEKKHIYWTPFRNLGEMVMLAQEMIAERSGDQSPG